MGFENTGRSIARHPRTRRLHSVAASISSGVPLLSHPRESGARRGTEKALALEREFAAVGVEVVHFPSTMHTSSTQLRRALDAITAGVDHRAALQGQST